MSSDVFKTMRDELKRAVARREAAEAKLKELEQRDLFNAIVKDFTDAGLPRTAAAYYLKHTPALDVGKESVAEFISMAKGEPEQEDVPLPVRRSYGPAQPVVPKPGERTTL